MYEIRASFLALLVFHFFQLQAQQETYLTHTNYNRMFVNPAFAGNNAIYEISSFHHRQWVGLLDQTGKHRTADNLPVDPLFPVSIFPVTSGFSFSAPIAYCKSGDKIELGGYGISLFNDAIGYENNTAIKGSIAASMKTNPYCKFRVGLELNYLSKRINSALMRAHQNPDPMIPAANNPADAKMLLGAGIVFENSRLNNWITGFSIGALNREQFNYLNNVGQTIQIATATHATFFTTANFKLNHSDFELLPFLLVRSVNDGNGWVMPQLETQLNVEYKNKFSLATGLRGQKNGLDAMSFLLGFYPSRLNLLGNGKLRIGYSYDITFQSLRKSSRNSHELQLNYVFDSPCKPIPKIRHPRDLEFNFRDRV